MKKSQILGLAVTTTLLWASAYAISDFTLGGYVRSIGHKQQPEKVQASSDSQIKKYLSLLTEETATVQQLVEGANAVIGKAESVGDLELLLKGISLLSRALEIDPQAQEALFAMADVSFKAGAFDKSYEYYAKLVELNPKDLRSITNMALSLTQLGRSTEAVKILEAARKDAPHNFQVLLTLALALRESGDVQGAKKVGEQALKLAPDEQGKQLLSSFVAQEPAGESINSSTASTQPDTGKFSYTALAESFFNEHQVLGPKLKGLDWEGQKLTVSLENFPIEQMPPFARTSLEAKLKELSEKGNFVFTLIDSTTRKELLTIGE